MSTTVTYKGQTLTTVENETKTLTTGGTWMEGDLTLTDVTQGGGGWTTDGIADQTEPNGAITISSSVTKIGERAMFNRAGITEVTIDGDPFIQSFAFAGCSNIVRVYAPNLTKLKTSYYNTATYVFQNCSKLVGIVLPNYGNETLDSYMFQRCTAFTYADFGNLQRMSSGDVFDGTALNLLILRKTDAVVTLSGVTCFRGSPFASGGTGGEIYVPQALLSTYPTSTNWSTLDGYGTVTWKAIEGSYYETHYADGTEITA